MKKISYILLLLVALFSAPSCNTLDIENIYSYDADKVWNDENLAKAYLTNLYANVFDNWRAGADSYSQQVDGIAFYQDLVTITNSNFKQWKYETIRQINEVIQNTTNGQLSQAIKDEIVGQALFMRAYVYFDMVKHHGGIPYIKVPQNKDTDDLHVKRNSTVECFQFIIEDLDEAFSKLPLAISKTSAEYGHIDGCFAKAFKAKVLLYKASPQFHPSHPWDNADWQTAYTACQDAYNTLSSNGYKLASDYDDIFLKEAGPEVVFAVINQYPNKVADWDNGVRPGSLSRGNASYSPTWEFVKEFPMKDGKQYNDPESKYYVASEGDFLNCYWKNRDPRFDKSVIWNASLYSVGGTPADRRQYTALGIAHELDDFGTNPKANVNSTNLNNYSGFFIRKASDTSLSQAQVQQYDIDYIVMRFAEVMLNYAETANETGHSDVTIDILKQIRERAGIEPGDDGNYGIDVSSKESLREAVLQERNIEFCFEGFRFWDLRRLRMLDRLNGTTKHGIESIAINADGSDMSMEEAKEKASKFELTEKDFRYVIHQIPFSGVKVSIVPDTYYFFPIQQSSIDRNSNLEQNNNWGGTFNPTLE